MSVCHEKRELSRQNWICTISFFTQRASDTSHCDKYLELLRDDGQHSNHYTNQSGRNMNKPIVDFFKEPRSVQEIMDKFDFDSRTSFRRKYLSPMLEKRCAEYDYTRKIYQVKIRNIFHKKTF
jgi:hypothetical protein